MAVCKIWIITDPQASGPGRDLKIREGDKLVTSPASRWRQAKSFGLELDMSFAGDGRDIGRRFDRAEVNEEVIQCEVDVNGVGVFRGKFKVHSAKTDSLRGRHTWIARITPAKADAVTFKPAQASA